MIPYSFIENDRGGITFTKRDGNPETKFVLFTERDNGYGMYTDNYGVDDDEWQLHRLARPASLEYFSGEDERYYRLSMASVRESAKSGNAPTEPEPLEVRHQCWFGESENEMRRKFLARRRQKLEAAINRARQRKAREEERKLREAEEAAKLARVEAEFAETQPETFEEELARMLAEEGLSDFSE